MARGRRGRGNEGIGMIVIGFGLILFVAVLIMIPELPFETTVAEQSMLYLTTFLFVVAGLIMAMK